MIRAWWEGLQARERRIVAVGAIVVCAMLGWALLWYPLSHARADLAAHVAHQRDNLVWMRQALAEVKDLRAQGARSRADRQGKSLLALADASARGAGLTGALKRVEPAGSDSVRVNLEIADFDAVVNWLDGLARDYGVQATDFSADKIEGIGLVNARVTLQDSKR